MAESTTVTANVDTATALQYNNLRKDVLATDVGHLHDGTNGREHGDQDLKLRNPGDTFSYVIRTGAIVADRDLSLPVLTGSDTIAVLALAQTFTNKTLTSPVLNTAVTGTAYASQAEAEAGSATNKIMNPLRTKQAIAGQAPPAHDLGGASHSADTLANLNTKVSDGTLVDRDSANTWGAKQTITQVEVSSTTDATSATSAPLKSAGGGAIAKSLYVGGASGSGWKLDSPTYGEMIFSTPTAISVGASATNILGGNLEGGLVTVAGAFNDGGTLRRFVDVILYSLLESTVDVIASQEANTPSNRTYARDVTRLTLQMASGTYNVRAAGQHVTIPTS